MAEAGIFTGEFMLDNFFWLHCFQPEFRAWHAETGGCAVEVHVYGPSPTLDEPDAVLLARALQDLTRVWPTLRGTSIQQSIRRNPASHTLFSSDGDQLAVETPWKGITACGDWVRFPHPALYMERAVVTGIAASNRILEGLGSPPAPILQPDQPELPARAMQRGLRWVRRQAKSRKARSTSTVRLDN